jgi:hypothetical protein
MKDSKDLFFRREVKLEKRSYEENKSLKMRQSCILRLVAM